MKHLSRRSFLKYATIAAAGTTLAACQSPQPTQQPSTNNDAPAQAPAAKEKQKITFTTYGFPNMIEEMVPIFNKSQEDVEVTFERSEGQGYWEKLTASVAAGTAWDVFRGNVNTCFDWGPKGVVVDAKSYIENDSRYPKEDYLDGVLDVFTVEDKTYGVPGWALTMWLFYNKKMFDEAGIPYPTPETTWDEYVEMTRKLTKRDGDKFTQFGANGWTWWTFPIMQLVWSNGGKFYYSDDFKSIAVNDPKTVEVLQKIADLHLVEKVSPNPSVQQSSPVGILSDNVATEGNGDYFPWDNKDVFESKLDYIDATLCPSFGGNRANIYWADCHNINGKTKYPEAAYKWTAWYARSTEATAIQCKVVFPLFKSAYTDESIAKQWLVAPRPPGMIAAAREHAKNARLYKVEKHISEIDNIFYQEIGALWNGDADAKTVAQKITDLCNEAMSNS